MLPYCNSRVTSLCFPFVPHVHESRALRRHAAKLMGRGVLMLSRLSFRQLLLAAFLLIAALLSGTSVHALLTLERLAAHSRESARHAVQLTEDAQLLAERTVAMERSARQFLILDDPAFRTRYVEA